MIKKEIKRNNYSETQHLTSTTWKQINSSNCDILMELIISMKLVSNDYLSKLNKNRTLIQNDRKEKTQTYHFNGCQQTE